MQNFDLIKEVTVQSMVTLATLILSEVMTRRAGHEVCIFERRFSLFSRRFQD